MIRPAARLLRLVRSDTPGRPSPSYRFWPQTTSAAHMLLASSVCHQLHHDDAVPLYSVGFAVVPVATHGGCEQLCGLARFKGR